MTTKATVGKSQLAYEHLRERITRGAYGPGYRLVLDQLARELRMSVVPVREAIRRLEAEGVVTFERNVGARVAAIDPVDYRDACQTLAIVEGAAVALAQPHLAAADLAEARAVNDRLRECLADFDPVRFTRLNEAFHRTLSDPCPNAQLKNLVDVGWLRLAGLRRSTFGFVPGRAHASVAEHDALLALLTAGASPADVEAAVREHRLAGMRAYLDRDPTRTP
jgi:DNA-binding GntR family transcriptional regulator